MRRALVLVFLVACKDDKKPPPPAPSASQSTAPTVTSVQTTTQSTSVAVMPVGDGGACAIDVGPLQMDFKGPAAIAATEKGALVAGNDKGTPHVVTIENKKASAAPGNLETSRVPCAIARGTPYCPGDDGTIKGVGKSRPGTKIAAAEIGGHAVVAFISERKTTEGMTQTAEVWSDDGPQQRLSEEGNGATFVDLAARDGEVVSMMIDAHMGMTPVHARTLSWSGKLALGADTVLMIAGNAEANTAGALASKHDKGPSFALVPIAKDISAFGVAAIRIDSPPKVDSKVEWSLYDNGLDPAPIAATHDAARIIVARVRPIGKEAHSPRALELGTLDADGKFASLGTVATHGSARDVAMSADKQGIWLAYTDQQGTWVDHRVCP